MVMLSFRVRDEEAQEATQCATEMGIDLSELLREALRRYLAGLAASAEADAYARAQFDSGERSLAAIADWGPAEDWSDWSRAADTRKAR